MVSELKCPFFITAVGGATGYFTATAAGDDVIC